MSEIARASTPGPARNLSRAFGDMQPVQVLAASDLVLEQIRTAFMLGRFPPGESLPPERQLAQFLGVSRATVREALAVLAYEGAIEIRRGRGGGIFVKDLALDATVTAATLSRNRRHLRDIFDFRMAVEPAAARLAAQRRTGKALKGMDQLLKEMAQYHTATGEMPDDPVASAEFHSLDTDLHLLIAASANNERLYQATLTGRVEMFRPIGGFFRRHAENADALHACIVKAIRARDGDMASDLMSQHIEGTRRVVEGWLSPRSARQRIAPRGVARSRVGEFLPP